MTKPTLSPVEFLRVSEFIKADPGRSLLEDTSLDYVRSVVVDGRRQSEVARDNKVSRQWISLAVQKFRRAHALYEQRTIPKGWKAETVTLPIEAWNLVRQLEEKERAALKRNGA